MIAEAIDANYAQAPGHRRLRYLRELFRGARRPSAGDLAARLGAWCEGGEHAWLFDNDADRARHRRPHPGLRHDQDPRLARPSARRP